MKNSGLLTQAVWRVVFIILPVLVGLYVSHTDSGQQLARVWIARVRSFAVPPGGPAAAVPSQQFAKLADSLDKGTCQLTGKVDDTCCDCTYSAVQQLNADHVHPVVSQLAKTAFFRYFKVNIYCDCPLWPDDGMCALRACSVCECDEAEVPLPWRTAEAQSCSKEPIPEAECHTPECVAEREGHVDRGLDPGVKKQLLHHSKGWRGFNNPWMAEGEESEEYLYINLLVNPERYTGYKGEHAHRIWSAIYNQSCFTDGVTCTEERVFYRLLSGMHTSISLHLVDQWLLDEPKNLWGPNLEEFERRLGKPAHKERVENLYFAYLFVLRAVLKAAPLLSSYDYSTGLPEEDIQTQALMSQLLLNPAISESCPTPFDEGRLWKGDNAAELKVQLQATFQNITRVMDCVGCEKCKLWGKLQTLGIATALKVLFSARDCDGSLPATAQPFSELHLERNEAIALINLLARFSNSLQTYHRLAAMLQQQKGQPPSLDGRTPLS